MGIDRRLRPLEFGPRLRRAAAGGAGPHAAARAGPARQHRARPPRRREHAADAGGGAGARCGGGQQRRVRRQRAIHAGRGGVPERGARTFARLRRYARGRVAASGLPGDPGGAGRGGDGGRIRGEGAGGDRRRLRGDVPGGAGLAGRRALRARASTRRRRAACSARRRRRRCVRARPGRDRVGARDRAQPVGGQPAVPRQRRVDQALPGRLGQHVGPGGRGAGARGVQGRGGGARGQARVPPRLRPLPRPGARHARPRPGVGADADGGEAVPLLPLRPCRDRRRHRLAP